LRFLITNRRRRHGGDAASVDASTVNVRLLAIGRRGSTGYELARHVTFSNLKDGVAEGILANDLEALLGR
jgi:hypothetical protein